MYKITKDDIEFCDSFTRKLCAKICRRATDDAIQSGREGMVIAAHKFDPSRNDSFTGYATWAIRYQVYRIHFGFGARHEVICKNAVAYNDDIRYIDNSGESTIINQLTANAMINSLNDNERFVALQRGLLEKSGREIAAEFGKSYQTYDQRYRRVRRKLRKRFGKELNHGEM